MFDVVAKKDVVCWPLFAYLRKSSKESHGCKMLDSDGHTPWELFDFFDNVIATSLFSIFVFIGQSLGANRAHE